MSLCENCQRDLRGPVSRTQAKIDGTFGVEQPFEKREAKPAVDSVDAEYQGSQSRSEIGTITPLEFTQRDLRGEAAVPEVGPPVNREEREPLPYTVRVREGDEERLGLA